MSTYILYYNRLNFKKQRNGMKLHENDTKVKCKTGEGKWLLFQKSWREIDVVGANLMHTGFFRSVSFPAGCSVLT